VSGAFKGAQKAFARSARTSATRAVLFVKPIFSSSAPTPKGSAPEEIALENVPSAKSRLRPILFSVENI